jgi:hypothetical protein
MIANQSILICNRLEMSIRCRNLPQTMSSETPPYRQSCKSSRIPCRGRKNRKAIGITNQQGTSHSKDSSRRAETSTLSLAMSLAVPPVFPRYQLLRTASPKASRRITPSKNSKKCALLTPSKCTQRPNPSIFLNFQTNYPMPKEEERRRSETG